MRLRQRSVRTGFGAGAVRFSGALNKLPCRSGAGGSIYTAPSIDKAA
jgi:hypothetical protein